MIILILIYIYIILIQINYFGFKSFKVIFKVIIIISYNDYQ